jgi:hypothetical protein
MRLPEARARDQAAVLAGEAAADWGSGPVDLAEWPGGRTWKRQTKQRRLNSSASS